MNKKYAITVLILSLLTTHLFAQKKNFNLGDETLEFQFEVNTNNQLKQRLVLPVEYRGSTGLPSSSSEFFPLGMPGISDDFSPVALGLEHKEADYYAVWRLSGDNVIRINVKNKGEAEILYPTYLEINLNQGEGVFTVSFSERYMAAIIKVKK